MGRVPGVWLHPEDHYPPASDMRVRVREAGDMSGATNPERQGPPPLVVVGASAGGVEALRDFVSVLPADLPACVLVVLHVPADAPSALPAILGRAGPLPARQAVHGEELRAGRILVAPPDHHLLVVDGSLALTHGPHENGHRPAVDVLFRSAARAAGPNVVAVVLSGSLDDGAAGVVAVASRGGRVMVQSFDEALYSSMPRAAAAAAGLDRQVRVVDMGETLSTWLAELSGPAADDAPATMQMEVGMADLDPRAMHEPDRPGTPAGFGCPDCAGALYQIEEGNLRRYRCRVGHAWSPESLLAQQTSALEGALWTALRSLEEKAALSSDLGRRAGEQGHGRTASKFHDSAGETLRAAELVRQLIDEIGSARADETMPERGSA